MSETLREEVDRLTLGLVNAVMDPKTTIDIIASMHTQCVNELCAMFERRVQHLVGAGTSETYQDRGTDD